MSLNLESPMQRELGALTESERSLGSGLSTVVTPTWSHVHVSLYSCVTLAAWHSTGRRTFLADSLASALADDTSLLHQAHVQYQSGTGGSTVEKPAETQTSIQLASHLFRAPNSSSGKTWVWKSPMWPELSALTRSGKILGVRSFYNT